VILSAVGALGWVVERQFVAVAEALPDYRQNIENKFQRFRTATHGKFSKAANAVQDTLDGMATTPPSPPSSTEVPRRLHPSRRSGIPARGYHRFPRRIRCRFESMPARAGRWKSMASTWADCKAPWRHLDSSSYSWSLCFSIAGICAIG